MGKKASNRPNRPKSVQKRPSVQNQVLQRIVTLKNSGMGFRKISKQLAKEGIANVSKGTVANYWKQAQTNKNKAAKRLLNNPKLKILAKTKAKLRRKVDHAQITEQNDQEIRDLQIQRAETQEGLHDIFENKEELLEFALHTLKKSKVLKAFMLHCEANRLPPAETLAKAVGSLDDYEAEKETLDGDLDLPSCIEERMESFLLEEKQRKRDENKRIRHEQLQKQFSAMMLNFKCTQCNPTYDSVLIDTDEGDMFCAKCHTHFNPLCLECGAPLVFDAKKHVFYCSKCHAIFKLPTLSLSDFTFIRER